MCIYCMKNFYILNFILLKILRCLIKKLIKFSNITIISKHLFSSTNTMKYHLLCVSKKSHLHALLLVKTTHHISSVQIVNNFLKYTKKTIPITPCKEGGWKIAVQNRIGNLYHLNPSTVRYAIWIYTPNFIM
jgi:hypothetical protein